jgi:hypothetical protein
LEPSTWRPGHAGQTVDSGALGPNALAPWLVDAAGQHHFIVMVIGAKLADASTPELSAPKFGHHALLGVPDRKNRSFDRCRNFRCSGTRSGNGNNRVSSALSDRRTPR